MLLDLVRESSEGINPDIANEIIDKVPDIIRKRITRVLEMQHQAEEGDKNAKDKYDYSNCHTIANYIGLWWVHLWKNHFPWHWFDILDSWYVSPLKDTKMSLDSIHWATIARMRVDGDWRLLHSFIVLWKSWGEIICIDADHRRKGTKHIKITSHDNCIDGYIERYNSDIWYSSMISDRLWQWTYGYRPIDPNKKRLFYKPVQIHWKDIPLSS